jgi:hypothetical protein
MRATAGSPVEFDDLLSRHRSGKMAFFETDITRQIRTGPAASTA